MEEIIYFELNNWGCGSDYPDAEPFIGWMSDYYETPAEERNSWIAWGSDEMNQQFKEWGICVVVTTIDMSINFCITAPRSWIEKYCPELLTKYTKFIRKPNKYGDVYGKFTTHFVDYSKENIGLWYDIEANDGGGYYYQLVKYDEWEDN